MVAGLAADSKKPNVIFILTDDQGYIDLGIARERLGGVTPDKKYGATPHIDQLFREGMMLTSFYPGGSVCNPSRHTLFTGLHAPRLNIRTNEVNLKKIPADVLTLAELFQAKGYVTGHFGKWGMASQGETMLHGFDETVVRVGALVNEDMMVSYNDGPGVVTEGHATNIFMGEAVDFMVRHKDRPFYLHISLSVPHLPVVAPPYYSARWPDDEYQAVIEHMDDSIGSMLKQLDLLGLKDNTIVLFASDNGGQVSIGADNGPLRGSKGMMTEGGIRGIAGIRWPGVIPANVTNDSPIIGEDLLPTFAEVIGYDLKVPVDGVSQKRVLVENGVAATRLLYWEYKEGSGADPQSGCFNFAGIREGNWKLYYAPRLAPESQLQLYRLDQNLGEKNWGVEPYLNLASLFPHKVAELFSKYRQKRHRITQAQYQILEVHGDFEGQYFPWQCNGGYAVLEDTQHFFGQANFSMRMRIKPRSVPAATVILAEKAGRWSLSLNSDLSVELTVFSDLGNEIVLNGGSLNVGEWSDVVFTHLDWPFDENVNEIKLYVDGVQVGENKVDLIEWNLVNNPVTIAGNGVDSAFLGEIGAIDFFASMLDDNQLDYTSAAPAAGYGSVLEVSEAGAIDVSPGPDLSGGSFTVEFWCKRNAASYGVRSNSIMGSSAGDLIIRFGSDDQFKFHMNGSALTYFDIIQDEYWRHWACVYDYHPTKGSGTRLIYRNGKLVARDEGVAKIANPTAMILGSDVYGNGASGMLDEIRIWSKARTSEEIDSTWNTVATGEEANLLACYGFDVGAPPICYNRVGGTKGQYHGVSRGVSWKLDNLSDRVARVQMLQGDTQVVSLFGSKFDGAYVRAMITRPPVYGSLYQYSLGGLGERIDGRDILVEDPLGRVVYRGDNFTPVLEDRFSYRVNDGITNSGPSVDGQATVIGNVDRNGDGMRDIWQQAYPHTLGNPDGDEDGDGKTNLEEERAGTDPTDGTAFLRVHQLHLSSEPGGGSIEWQGVIGKRYQIERSGNLLHWMKEGDPVIGTAGLLNFHVNMDGNAEREFWRIKMLNSLNSDGDGLNDYEEQLLGTSILESDSDGDGVRDEVEFLLGLKPLDKDSDSDTLEDGEELELGTDPLRADTDGDGLRDDVEVASNGKFDPLVADTDGDGLNDNYSYRMVGHWTLDEENGGQAIDSSGSGLNGVWRGNPVPSPGAKSGGLQLDGVDDFVELPQMEPLNSLSQGDYSISMWFKPDQYPPSEEQDPDAVYSMFGNGAFKLHYRGSGKFAWVHLLGDVDNTSIWVGSGVFPPAVAYHIVATVDVTAGKTTLYVNGVKAGEGAFVPGTAGRVTALPWLIGSARVDPTAPNAGISKGLVDEVRVYDRVLLPEEATGLYLNVAGVEGGNAP